MLRDYEVISEPVEESTWKRIDRLLPEAAGADPSAAIVYLLGFAAIVLAAILTG